MKNLKPERGAKAKAVAKALKAHQDKLDASVLLEPQIAYDTLVQVMDKVRVYTPKSSTRQTELFPAVSVGDAPT